MSVTMIDLSQGSIGTYFDTEGGASPLFVPSMISGNEIEFTATYNGELVTLWFRGDFDISRVPSTAQSIADFEPLASTALITSFGFKDFWVMAFDPAISFMKLNEYMEARSNLDYENFFSGDDVYFNAATAAFEDGGSSSYLYEGNDVYHQNHRVMKYHDIFYGGDGVDTLVMPGRLANYDIVESDYVWDHAHQTNGLTGYYITDLTQAINTTQINEVERIEFSDTMLALDTGKGEIAGSAYRLYKAAFDRAAEADGLGFWINTLDNGANLVDVAQGFINSAEFTAMYGANPTDQQFVTLLYNHVLHRAPEGEGYQFWLDSLSAGVSRAQVLKDFSESTENINQAAELIANGIQYEAWIVTT